MAKRFLTTIQAITATFTGNVTAANPTLPQHLATKNYVDNFSPSVIVENGSEYPSSASNGQIFYNTSNGNTAIYFDSVWREFAYSEPEQIDGGLYSTTTFDNSIDGGSPSETTFIGNYDGGSY